MKTLNIVRRIILVPLKLIFAPLWIGMGFLLTDFSKKEDREFFKENIKILLP